MIPTSTLFDQSTIAALLDHDPLIADYRAFFALLDWSVVEQWEAERSPRGRPAHPESAYLKAFLIRIREGMAFTAQLLGSQPGLRVVHIPVPLDFDTHEGQPRKQAANLAAIDAGLEAFLTDLQKRGLAAKVA